MIVATPWDLKPYGNGKFERSSEGKRERILEREELEGFIHFLDLRETNT